MISIIEFSSMDHESFAFLVFFSSSSISISSFDSGFVSISSEGLGRLGSSRVPFAHENS